MNYFVKHETERNATEVIMSNIKNLNKKNSNEKEKMSRNLNRLGIKTPQKNLPENIQKSSNKISRKVLGKLNSDAEDRESENKGMKSMRRLDKEKFERDQETNRSTFRGAN